MGRAIPSPFEFRALTNLVRKGCAPPPETEPVLPTGLAELDRHLPGGGLPAAGLSELTGSRAAGKLTLAFAIAAAALARGELACLIDPDATAAPNVWLEPNLERLLVIRGGGILPALRATAALLETGAFTLLILDLPGRATLDAGAPFHDGTRGRARGVSPGTFTRLARAAHTAHTSLLILSEMLPWRPHGITPAVSVRLEVRSRRHGYEIAVTKRRGGAPGESIAVARATLRASGAVA